MSLARLALVRVLAQWLAIKIVLCIGWIHALLYVPTLTLLPLGRVHGVLRGILSSTLLGLTLALLGLTLALLGLTLALLGLTLALLALALCLPIMTILALTSVHAVSRGILALSLLPLALTRLHALLGIALPLLRLALIAGLLRVVLALCLAFALLALTGVHAEISALTLALALCLRQCQ